MPLALSDMQLKALMAYAAGIPLEKRDDFLRRVAAMLALRGRFDDRDVAEVARLALTGLARSAA
jgi:hypothetical protein